jgi:hypothetical protein
LNTTISSRYIPAKVVCSNLIPAKVAHLKWLQEFSAPWVEIHKPRMVFCNSFRKNCSLLNGSQHFTHGEINSTSCHIYFLHEQGLTRRIGLTVNQFFVVMNAAITIQPKHGSDLNWLKFAQAFK